MSRLDERLTRELERAARPADPTRAFERVDRKRARRAVVRRLQAGGLVVVVLAGTVGGFALLSKALRDPTAGIGGTVSPAAIELKANGRIVVAQQSQGGPLQLVSVNPDGSGREVIPTNVDFAGDPWLPAWSPDGTKLAVAVFPSGGGPRDIWVIDANGSNPVKIANAMNVSRPSWSPDGTSIAYAATTEATSSIHIVNANGSQDRIVGESITGKTFFSAAFSPSGNQILYARGTDSGFNIFVMSKDGSNVRQITTTGTDYDPSWSPDGGRIAFTRQDLQRPDSNIYVMNADGSDVQRLTDDGPGVTDNYPEWSPDGQTIAYVAGVNGGPGSLVLVNADGSHPVTILNDGVIGVSWQPLPIGSTPAPAPADLGLGFPVCDVTAVVGNWGGNAPTAFLAAKMSDVGGCPAPEAGASRVLGIDTNGDGKIDVTYGPLECRPSCQFFGAPDIDQDGVPELAIVQGMNGSTASVRIYTVVIGDQQALVPWLVDGTTLELDWDTSQDHPAGAFCNPSAAGPELVVWHAERLAEGHYRVTRVWYHMNGTTLGGDGAVQPYTETIDVPGNEPSLPPMDTFCGWQLSLGSASP